MQFFPTLGGEKVYFFLCLHGEFLGRIVWFGCKNAKMFLLARYSRSHIRIYIFRLGAVISTIYLGAHFATNIMSDCMFCIK